MTMKTSGCLEAPDRRGKATPSQQKDHRPFAVRSTHAKVSMEPVAIPGSA